MTKPDRPKPQKKGDYLLSREAVRNEVAVDHCVAVFDAKAREMDARWGIDRLPEIVGLTGPDGFSMVEKYGRALGAMNEAIRDQDAERAKALAQNLVNGMKKLDAIAINAGHKPASGTFWEYEIEGEPPFRFGVLKDDREWEAAKKERPDLKMYSMREVGLALQATTFAATALDDVKQAFPDAKPKVTKIKAKLEKPDYRNGGDPIPF